MKEGVVINKALKDKTHEALSSVLPVSLIILLLAMTVAPVSVVICILCLLIVAVEIWFFKRKKWF